MKSKSLTLKPPSPARNTNTMSQLSELYELRLISQEFGMAWTEKQECQFEVEK